ncbi:MAG TPA: hypothetical protein PKC21_07355 [Oligoflexia bacterium]|nr:hypothetical protein [Oligoflexia bacterium]HMR25153.1 hypothetical protein [Oligoflexia bacterium]
MRLYKKESLGSMGKVDILNDVFGMPLFPHIYAIPFSIILGMILGYKLRGNTELFEDEDKRPPKPKI